MEGGEAGAHLVGEDVAAGRGPLGELDRRRPAGGEGGEGPAPPPVGRAPASEGGGEGGERERAENQGVADGADAPAEEQPERAQPGGGPIQQRGGVAQRAFGCGRVGGGLRLRGSWSVLDRVGRLYVCMRFYWCALFEIR